MDGRTLNFCCAGCLQVYEFLREEGALPRSPGSESQRTPAKPAGATRNARLPIIGMSCANCAACVERSLRAIAGVAQATVSLTEAQATVRFDPAQTNIAQMAAAVRAAGYDADAAHAAETPAGKA